MAKKSEQQKQYYNKFHKDFLRIVHIKKKKIPRSSHRDRDQLSTKNADL